MTETIGALPLHLGQLVRRRTDPEGAAVGVVAGLVFVSRCLVLVRWNGAPSTYEPEDTLVDVRPAGR